jgi:hypothetical protein
MGFCFVLAERTRQREGVRGSPLTEATRQPDVALHGRNRMHERSATESTPNY